MILNITYFFSVFVHVVQFMLFSSCCLVHVVQFMLFSSVYFSLGSILKKLVDALEEIYKYPVNCPINQVNKPSVPCRLLLKRCMSLIARSFDVG